MNHSIELTIGSKLKKQVILLNYCEISFFINKIDEIKYYWNWWIDKNDK